MLINFVKGLHILAVIAWMAGLLYLPRLFVYHSRTAVGSETDAAFKEMERKLLRGIMNPAMIAVLLFGATLVALEGVAILKTPWMSVKLGGVLFLLVFHGFLSRHRRRLAEGRRDHTERFWRLMNETPFIAAAVIVLAVTTKFVF
jgi:putative membrane protein